MMTRTMLYGLLASGLTTLISCKQQTTEKAAPIPPNIIFIMADDLGYGDIGTYGQDKIATPFLDEMARQGIHFSNFYAGTSVCAPSRASLMLGKHTGHLAIRGNRQDSVYGGQMALLDTDRTIAEYLKKVGYATKLIGKWGLGNPRSSGDPSQQGFDSYYGYTDQILAHNYYPEFLWKDGKKQLLDNTVQYLEKDAWHGGLGSYSTEKKEYSHDLFMKETVAFLETERSEPFFLYLSLTIPHDNGEQLDSMRFEVPQQGVYKNKKWTKNQKDYAAMITRMDQGIGTVMETLKKQGLDDNTLVIFTSDNGPMRQMPTTAFFNSNGPFRGGKRDLYEGGIRMPFIAKWPGKIKPHSVSDHPSAFWDILPTLSELAGNPLTETDETDGISFVPTLLAQEQTQKHPALYWEFHGSKEVLQAVRKDNYKLVKKMLRQDTIVRWELFDIATDAEELTDLYERRPKIALELRTLLQESHLESPVFVLPDEQKERSVGYTGH